MAEVTLETQQRRRSIALSLLLLTPLLLFAATPSSANPTTSNTSVEVILEDERLDTGQMLNWSINLTSTTGWVNIDHEIYQGYSNNGSLLYQDTALWSISNGSHILNGGSVAGFEIWNGTYEYTIRVEVWDQNRTTLLAFDEQKLLIFQHTIAPNPTKFIVFGDSLSDMGNTYNTIARVPESPPYWNGRFSNGPIWAELVGQGLGQTISHGTGSSSGTNRAWGGAKSGGGHTSVIIPNSGTQVQEYTDNHYIQPTEMAAIWIGGNDFVGGNHQNVQEVVDNIAYEVSILAQNGARSVIVMDMPSLEKTPKNQDDSAAEKQALHNQMIDFNARLANDLGALSQTLNISIQVVPMMAMFETMYWNKSFYGFTYTTVAACPDGGDVCDSNDYIAPNPNEYIFFDQLHPTANSHSLIATYILEQIGIADTDADGVIDSNDNCPQTPLGDSVNHFGCRLVDLDSDSDGVNDLLDLCPGTTANATVDEFGCADYQRDSDNDGVTDDIDMCPQTNGGYEVDEQGCADYQKDSDLDGVTDDIDVCPNTDVGALVNEIGCAQNQLDDDWDEVMNDADLCPATPLGEVVDENGCSDTQLDSDSDGVSNALDLCDYTPEGEEVNENGCALSQLDSDLDGVSDSIDECDLTPFGQTPDEKGCSASQRDTDGDGRMDDVDECVEIQGSIRGCPRLELQVMLLSYPQTYNETAGLQVAFSCESSCLMQLLVNDEWYTELNNSTLQFDIGPYEHQHSFEVRVEATGTEVWARQEVNIEWPDKPPPPPIEKPSNDEQNTEQQASEEEGELNAEQWQASSSVEGLLALFLIMCIGMVLLSLIQGPKRASGTELWKDPTALNTFEVEREMRITHSADRVTTDDLGTNQGQQNLEETPITQAQPVSNSGEQFHPPADISGFDNIPSIDELLD